ncbi:hypothetical protein [Streptomyces sp. NPDC057428]|uniref:hypothetical protein n=1 Tax=Streptomyces sp. NPDC057428 TaxID=3346129 RepID=UPI003699C6BC
MTSPTSPSHAPATSSTAPATPSPAPQSHTWALWLLVMVLFSSVVALVVIMLKAHSGSGIAEAVLSGGNAFGTTVITCLGAVAAVSQLRRQR